MFTYPKEEKLKSRKIIDLLFTKGQSVAKYPLRMAVLQVDDSTQIIQIGVSVSKRYFKKATDRNYIKRLLRECYRLNKHLLIQKITKPHAFMLLYQSKETPSFEELNEKIIKLFEKFQEKPTEEQL
jgi:ribonuclease P protein component